MSRLRSVLIVTFHDLEARAHGGIVRLKHECEFYRSNGVEVAVLGTMSASGSVRDAEEWFGARCFRFPSASGAAKRAFGLSSNLGALGLAPPPELAYFLNPRLDGNIQYAASAVKPDLIESLYPLTARQTSRVARKLGVPSTVIEVDIEFVRLSRDRRIGQPVSPLYIHLLRLLEVSSCNTASRVFSLSEEDRGRLKRSGVTTPIDLAPNGVDATRYVNASQFKAEARKELGISPSELVFVYHGTDVYPPNRDAMEWLATEFIIAVRRSHPEATLLLINTSTQYGQEAAVRCLPAVDSGKLPMLLASADVAVAPLRAGAGTRLKILEYWALGLPVVATVLGVEGLPARDGENALLVDDADERFVAAALRVPALPDLGEKLGKAGQQLATRQFDWKVVLRDKFDTVNRLVAAAETCTNYAS